MNGSSADFRREDFAERIITRFHKAGCHHQCLNWKLRRPSCWGSSPKASSARYASYGAREWGGGALDGFGAGFAYLTHLKQFTVSALKIDRLFISSLDQTNSADHAIVHGGIDNARRMKIQTVAEGIETAE